MVHCFPPIRCLFHVYQRASGLPYSEGGVGDIDGTGKWESNERKILVSCGFLWSTVVYTSFCKNLSAFHSRRLLAHLSKSM